MPKKKKVKQTESVAENGLNQKAPVKLLVYLAAAFLFVHPLLSWKFITGSQLGSVALLKLASMQVFTVLIGLVVVYWFLQKNPPVSPFAKGGTVLVPVGVFGATLVVSTVFSVNPLTAFFGIFDRWEGLLTWLNYLILFFIGTIIYRRHLKLLLGAFLASVTLVSVYGLLQQFNILEKGAGAIFDGSRLYATVGNPLILGSLLILAILPLTSFVIDGIDRRLRLGAAVLLAVNLLVLILTYSRSSWLGLAAAALLFGYLSFRLYGRKSGLLTPATYILVAVILSLAVSSLISGNQTDIQTDSNRILERAMSTVKFSEGTALNRLLLWKVAANTIKERPFAGWGPNTFLLAFPPNKLPDWDKIFSEKPYPDTPHNFIFQIASNAGLLGLAAFLWFVVSFFLVVAGLLRRFTPRNDKKGDARNDKKGGARNDEKLLGIGLLCGVAGYWISTLFYFSEVTVTPIVFLFMGVLYGVKENPPVSPFAKGGAKRVVFGSVVMVAGLMIFLAIKPLFFDLHSTDFKSWDEAITKYENRAKVSPYEPSHWAELGGVYFRAAGETKNKEYVDGALTALDKSIELLPYWHWHFDTAVMVSMLGGDIAGVQYYAKAEQYARKLAAFDPYAARSHLLLGNSLLYQNKLTEAERSLKKASSLDPREPSSYLALGKLYELKGDGGLAKKYYAKTLENNPPEDILNQAKAALVRMKAE